MSLQGREGASVCFMLTSLDFGGAETQVISLASRLKDRGWKVRMISMIPPSAWLDKLESMHIEVVSLNMLQGIPDVRGLIRLVTLLRRWRPHVLHCHMVHANLLGRIARLAVNVPAVISTAHNINEGAHWREIAYRLTDRLSDVTTNVSQAAVDRYIQVKAAPRNRIRFIPNGLDTKRFIRNPAVSASLRNEMKLGNVFVWLAVGRIQVEKDYPSMLHAFAKAKDAKRSILLIVGRGPHGKEMEKLAGELGVSGLVHFLGVRTDVPDLMNLADGYVMSSAWEGLPMVLLEASASELPVVATDVGGNREVVVDGKTGFIVPPNDPRALASAMECVMEMGEVERSEMGRAGRDHVEKYYSLEKVVDTWEELYGEILNRKGVVARPIPVS